jgi:hypothetical protein
VTFPPVLYLLLALSSNPSAGQTARPSPQAALEAAVQLFQNFEDQKSEAALRALLRRSPPKSVAARAHIYLALIALNATEPEVAQTEFEKAVRTDVLIDLPPGQSPKAQILFAEARREVASGPMPAAADSPSIQTATPREPAAAAAVAAQGSPSHLPAYVVGGIGVAALAAGGIFGWLQLEAGNSARNDPTLAAALSDGQPYAQDGLVADVLFGVGGAALITAIVLFATEGTANAPAVAFSAGPRGLALSGAF